MKDMDIWDEHVAWENVAVASIDPDDASHTSVSHAVSAKRADFQDHDFAWAEG